MDFEGEKNRTLSWDIASAADIGLEKALALTGDMASAPDIGFEPF